MDITTKVLIIISVFLIMIGIILFITGSSDSQDNYLKYGFLIVGGLLAIFTLIYGVANGLSVKLPEYYEPPVITLPVTPSQ